MYLKGSKLSMTRRRSRSNPLRLFILIVLVGGALYVNQVVVPATPPLFVPTPTPTRSPESYITDADALLEEGKISQAITAYEKAIQANPKNPAVYITAARLQVYNGLYDEAIANAENALLLNANNSIAHALRGWALGFKGEYLEAEAAIKTALEIDPNNAAAYAYRAEILARQWEAGGGLLGTLDNAIEASREAERLGPNELETHRARGIILELTANYEDASRQFESAIAINPNIADLHLALGRNYRTMELYDRAVEEFNRALALNPKDPLPNTYISRTYATVGEYAKAIQYAEQAIKADPTDPYLYGNLGQMYYKNVQYNDALIPLRLSVRGGTTADGTEIEGLPLDYGRVAEYYYTYGLTLAQMGECGEALQLSQLLQKAVPNDEYAMYNAQEIINVCSQVADEAPLTPQDATPEPAATPEA